MKLGFEQTVSPKSTKNVKRNPYQEYLLRVQQNQITPTLNVDSSSRLIEILHAKKKSTQNQNVSMESNSKIHHRPKPSMTQDEEERIGRLSYSVKETMIELEVNHESKPSQLQQIDFQKIIKIQTRIRKFLAKKQLLRLKKQNKYRRCVLNEICTTEESYKNALFTLIECYMKPLQKEQGIIGKQTLKSLFANIQAICNLSEQMHQILQNSLKTYNIHSEIVGKDLLQIISFFKIYSEYLNNYNAAFSLQMKLKKENQQYKKFLDAIDKKNNGKSLENYYLIQPVQRIPKYVLLFKDLLKNTNEKHPDYKNIQLVLNEFEMVANQNNKSMDSLLKNQKIFELQKQYGNQIKIIEVGREFLKEESLQMYFTKESEVRPVIVHFLSDLILVTERDQVKQDHILKSFIKINHLSQCQKLPEMHHFQYVFQINGVEKSATFMVKSQNSEQDLNEMVDFVNEMIRKLEEKKTDRERAILGMKPELKKETLQEKQQLSVGVQIQGTQELTDASNKKFTQYIFEIDINNITQKVFLRFSLFKKIQEEVKAKFPSVKFVELKDDSYFDRNDGIVVDKRKIGMIEFLQIVLNSKEFQSDMNQNQQILMLIGLPENFYQLPSLLQGKQKQSILQQQFSFRSSKKPQSVHIESLENLKNLRNFDNSNATTMLTQANSPRGPVKPMGDLVKLLQLSDTKKDSPQQQSKIQKPANIKGLRATSLMNSRKVSATQLVTMESRNSSRQGSIVSKDQINIESVKIKVMIFLDFKQVEKEYVIGRETSAFQLLEEITNEIQLQSAFDFRLYQIDHQYLKPLDHDEKLWTLLVKIEEAKSIFRKGSRQPVYNEKKLQLRKHLYVSNEEEKEFYKSDLVRLELVSYQLFDDISTFKLCMPPKDHLMYTALYLYLIGNKKIDPKKLPFNEIKSFVPPIAFKVITIEQWTNFLPTLVQNFDTQIKEEQQNDFKKKAQEKQKKEQNNQKEQRQDHLTESSIDDGMVMTEKHYTMLVFLDLIKSTRFYGVTNFPVKSDKESLNYLYELSKIYWAQKHQKEKTSQNQVVEDCRIWHSLYLSISHKSILVLQSLNSQLEQVEIDYADINSLSSFQQSLAIYLDSLPTNNCALQIQKKVCLKFETEKSYQIKQLIDEYVRIQMEQQQADELICNETLEQQ